MVLENFQLVYFVVLYCSGYKIKFCDFVISLITSRPFIREFCIFMTMANFVS
jgi:hypothetical protein